MEDLKRKKCDFVEELNYPRSSVPSTSDSEQQKEDKIKEKDKEIHLLSERLAALTQKMAEKSRKEHITQDEKNKLVQNLRADIKELKAKAAQLVRESQNEKRAGQKLLSEREKELAKQTRANNSLMCRVQKQDAEKKALKQKLDQLKCSYASKAHHKSQTEGLAQSAASAQKGPNMSPSEEQISTLVSEEIAICATVIICKDIIKTCEEDRKELCATRDRALVRLDMVNQHLLQLDRKYAEALSDKSGPLGLGQRLVIAKLKLQQGKLVSQEARIKEEVSTLEAEIVACTDHLQDAMSSLDKLLQENYRHLSAHEEPNFSYMQSSNSKLNSLCRNNVSQNNARNLLFEMCVNQTVAANNMEIQKNKAMQEAERERVYATMARRKLIEMQSTALTAKQDAEEALLSQFSSTFTQPSLDCIRLADSEGHSGSVNEQESKFLKSLEVIKTLSGSERLLAIIEAQINAVESTPTIVQVRSATQCEISLFAVPT